MADSREEELDLKCDRYWDAKCQMEFMYLVSLIDLARVRNEEEELHSDAEILDQLHDKEIFAYNRIDLHMYARVLNDKGFQVRYSTFRDLLKYYAEYFRMLNQDDLREEAETSPIDPKRFAFLHEQFQHADACEFFTAFLISKNHHWSHPLPSYERCLKMNYISETFIDHDLFVFLINSFKDGVKFDAFWNAVVVYYNRYPFPFGHRLPYQTEPIQLADDLQ